MAKKTQLQWLLLVSLYFLVILMIVFSVNAAKNIGQSGYELCIEDKCDSKGEEYCTKTRTLNNCCAGAGGTLGAAEGKYICLFN
jgi:hypothetical protein